MTRSLASGVLVEVRDITTHLIEIGLADVYSYPVLRRGVDYEVVEPAEPITASVVKAASYSALYESQVLSQAFNVRLPDGALLQLSYKYERGKLSTHRLAYLPSPSLTAYQDNPDVYIGAELFAEIVGQQVLAVPVRFDYDARIGVAEEGTHSTSHLTLGQYKHCRIPVSGPVTPTAFVEFVLDHFYSTPDTALHSLSRSNSEGFADSITDLEARGTHIQVRRPAA
jgi:hypothetical protein